MKNNNPIKKKILNKYLIIGGLFLILILLIDKNSLIKRASLLSEKHEIETQIKQYNVQIKDNNRKLKELQTNKENLEKFAREEYYMRQKNEDIYVIEEIEE